MNNPAVTIPAATSPMHDALIAFGVFTTVLDSRCWRDPDGRLCSVFGRFKPVVTVCRRLGKRAKVHQFGRQSTAATRCAVLTASARMRDRRPARARTPYLATLFNAKGVASAAAACDDESSLVRRTSRSCARHAECVATSTQAPTQRGPTTRTLVPSSSPSWHLENSTRSWPARASPSRDLENEMPCPEQHDDLSPAHRHIRCSRPQADRHCGRR